MRRALTTLLMLLACAPATAHGARQWSSGAALGPEGAHLHSAVLTPQDEIVAIMSRDGRFAAVTQPAGGGADVVQDLAPATPWRSAELAAGGGAAFAVLETDQDVLATRRAPGGAFGAPLRLGDGGSYELPDAAANADGEGIVVWGKAPRMASFALPGGGWSEPQPAPQGHVVLRPDGLAAFVRGSGRDLVLSTMRIGEAPQDRVVATGAHGDVTVAAAVTDASGRVAVGWREAGERDPTYERSFHHLHLTLWRGGDDVATLDLGLGDGLDVAVNAQGEGIAGWRGEAHNAQGERVLYGTGARFDIGSGTLGAVHRPLGYGYAMVAISGAGDVLVTNSHFEVFASRARPGGLLRAVSTVGCFHPGAQALMAAIDSRGQGIVVVGGHQPATVVRDQPAETWGRTWCGYVPQSDLPSYLPPPGYRHAGRPVHISMTAAVDPEATEERWEWDLDDDGVYEVDTGTTARLTHQFPAGVHAWRVRQTREYGGVSRETYAWRFHVDVAEAWPEPVATVPPPRLTIGRRSLRSVLRSGVPVTVRTPAAGAATVELRRRGSGVLLGRRSRTLKASQADTMRVPLRRSAKRRLKGARRLALEVRLVQGGRQLLRKRTTVR